MRIDGAVVKVDGRLEERQGQVQLSDNSGSPKRSNDKMGCLMESITSVNYSTLYLCLQFVIIL